MTRKVRLTITGTRIIEGQEDTSEQITIADYYDNGGRKYLFYTEDNREEETGVSSGAIFPEIRCRLTIGPDGIELKKSGSETNVLTFREGFRKTCTYHTPIGLMELVSFTRRIDMKENEDTLTIYMEYALYMGGELMSDHKLTIKAEALMTA